MTGLHSFDMNPYACMDLKGYIIYFISQICISFAIELGMSLLFHYIQYYQSANTTN